MLLHRHPLPGNSSRVQLAATSMLQRTPIHSTTNSSSKWLLSMRQPAQRTQTGSRSSSLSRLGVKLAGIRMACRNTEALQDPPAAAGVATATLPALGAAAAGSSRATFNSSSSSSSGAGPAAAQLEQAAAVLPQLVLASLQDSSGSSNSSTTSSTPGSSSSTHTGKRSMNHWYSTLTAKSGTISISRSLQGGPTQFRHPHRRHHHHAHCTLPRSLLSNHGSSSNTGSSSSSDRKVGRSAMHLAPAAIQLQAEVAAAAVAEQASQLRHVVQQQQPSTARLHRSH
uniref:Uncharacterized protein n=1 Tax=Tetradesmus obliquus TaxID=3088 RepID=A0A383WE97_TETOB